MTVSGTRVFRGFLSLLKSAILFVALAADVRALLVACKSTEKDMDESGFVQFFWRETSVGERMSLYEGMDSSSHIILCFVFSISGALTVSE